MSTVGRIKVTLPSGAAFEGSEQELRELYGVLERMFNRNPPTWNEGMRELYDKQRRFMEPVSPPLQIPCYPKKPYEFWCKSPY